MKSIAPIAAVLIALFSCNYQPDGEFIVVRPQPDATGMSVQLTDTEDTLFVYGYAEVRYNSIVNGKPVKWFRAYLKGEQVGTHNLESASFVLYTPYWADGCYTLSIELITSSGTGSLAEAKQVEEIKVQRTYVLCIDNSKPEAVDITSIRRADGTLELVWEKYPKQNFQKYKIFKYCYNQGYQQFEGHWIKEISNRETTVLRDSTFIGGKVKYVLSVIAANQESDYREDEFNDPYDLQLNWEHVDKTNMKLTWRKPAYYKNFTSYMVSFAYGSADDRTFTIDNINDTTLTLPHGLSFAVRKNVLVHAYPVRIDNYHPDYVYEYSKDIYLGNDFPWYVADQYDNEGVYNQSLNKYFAFQAIHGPVYELIRINASTNEVEQSFEAPWGSNFLLSKNGQYLYVISGDIFTRLDPLTFQVIQTYDVSILCGTSGGGDWFGSISGNNRLSLTNWAGNFVLDMNTFSIVQQWPSQQKSIRISTTGTFVIRGNELLKWNGTQYGVAGTVASMRPPIFIQNDTKVLLDNIDIVRVYNLNTMAIERTITMEESYNLRYDPVSGLLGAITDPYSSNARRFYLYSLNSNEKIKDFPIAGNIVLLNNSLVTPGQILPLSYFYP